MKAKIIKGGEANFWHVEQEHGVFFSYFESADYVNWLVLEEYKSRQKRMECIGSSIQRQDMIW
jgi:hypothetical protein